jgi:hypothetical protein
LSTRDTAATDARNALDVRHASFHSDMKKLIRELKRELVELEKQDIQAPMPTPATDDAAVARVRSGGERDTAPTLRSV